MKPPLPSQKTGCLLLPLFVLLLSFSAQATHIRAGEIYYTSDTTAAKNPLKFFITLVTYSVAPPHFEDLEATLHFGDCTSQKVSRTSRVLLPDAQLGTVVNIYRFEHTYSGPGTYHLTYVGSNRNTGTVNLSNSVQQAFVVQSTLTADPFLGTNRSPVLRSYPVDLAFRNQVFTHNSAGFDADGDSLSYKLVTPLMSNGEDACGNPLVKAVPEHRGLENFPGVTDPASLAGYSLNKDTGQLNWNTPGILGEFVVTMVVEEWRNGRLIGKVMRDRQLIVREASVVTGVAEEVEQLVTTYPNPASATLTVKAPSFVQLREIQAYNALGKPLPLPAPIKSAVGWSFDVQNASEGFYLLHLQTSHGKLVRKFVVKR